MRGATKLAAITLLTLAITGCGTVYFDVGSGRVRSAGYYYVGDSRYDHEWYYNDGLQWLYWDDGGWLTDVDFVWHDDSRDWYYYEYDPLYYDPWYDPYGDIYYDDPYYWDDAYWDDDYYYGDDWYWDSGYDYGYYGY